MLVQEEKEENEANSGGEMADLAVVCCRLLCSLKFFFMFSLLLHDVACVFSI